MSDPSTSLPEAAVDDAASIRTELPSYTHSTDNTCPNLPAPSYDTTIAPQSNPPTTQGSAEKQNTSPDQPHLQEALFTAAESGTPSDVLHILKLGAPLTSPDPASRSGRTPLHAAAAANNLPTTSLLLDLGTPPDIRDGRGDTPLHLAAAAAPGKNTDLVKLLLARGAAVDANGAYGYTPLHLAAEKRGNANAVRALLDAGADARVCCGPTCVTPLHGAAVGGDVEIVEALVAAGANVGARSTSGRTPYVTAAVKGHAEAMEALVAHGAERESHQGRRRGGPGVVGLLVMIAKEMVPRGLFGRRS